MHQRLDLLEAWHLAGAGLLVKKLATHSALGTTQWDKLSTARCGTQDIQSAVSKGWDAASGTGNAGSKTTDAELASGHGSGMGL
jgi:hypothetical protein